MELQVPKLTEYQFGELVFACEQSNYEVTWYLDLQTGEVEMLGDYIDNDPELEERIEEDFGDRYVEVPRIESWQGYEDMVEFTHSVPDEWMQEALAKALNSGRKGVFGRFKDTLDRSPTLLDQWYKFQEQRNRERVLKLFEEELLIQLIVE